LIHGVKRLFILLGVLFGFVVVPPSIGGVDLLALGLSLSKVLLLNLVVSEWAAAP
jgi:hypothetical protein